MSVSIEQIWDILASRPKFVFNPTLIFVAQYVLIIVVQLFCENVLHYYWNDFSFREMTFFVRPLKNANFHRKYYPSCVTSCNDSTWPPAFMSTLYLVLSSQLNPLSLLKLAKKYLFFGEYFCPTYFSCVEK